MTHLHTLIHTHTDPLSSSRSLSHSLVFSPTVMRRSLAHFILVLLLFFLVSFRNGTCNLWLSFVCCLVSPSFFVFLSIHDELEIAHFWAATADSLDHFPLELQVSLIRMRECAKHTHTTVHVFVCVCVCVYFVILRLITA